MENIKHKNMPEGYQLSGLFTTALRLVVGWTYFSAFWRRLVLADKLDPDLPGYIGEKFNHFLPNALGIKPMIAYLVTHPDTLWYTMVIFTIVEGIVGLFFMLGLFTRLMSIGVFGLAMGILLGAGWIGTTCLDEWQIGVLGIAAGFTIYLTGSGKFSVDALMISKNKPFIHKKWFTLLASGPLSIQIKNLHRIVGIGSGVILFITLFTNQYFHGGVWGNLHNKSVKPKLEITDPNINLSKLSFDVFRTEGADVYGSFLIGIALKDANDKTLFSLNGKDLSLPDTLHIDNYYVANVKPGAHSLIIPLGAKARITVNLPDNIPVGNNTPYTLILTDISGIEWEVHVLP